MDWLGMATKAAADLIERIPFERMLIKPRDTAQDQKEIIEILKDSPMAKEASKPRSAPAVLPSDDYENEKPTDKETIDYQKREIGKILLQMERHASQKFRINKKACECGQGKHLLDLEELCEETIAMVGNSEIYYKIIELGKELAPKAVPEIVATGRYDNEFPEYAKQYRNLRKELMGTLEYDTLFENKPAKLLELPPGETNEQTTELIPEEL